LIRESRHLIDVFTGVSAVRHTKSEVKIKGFQKLLLEVMPLNHPEVLDLLSTNSELNTIGDTIKKKY